MQEAGVPAVPAEQEPNDRDKLEPEADLRLFLQLHFTGHVQAGTVDR